MRTPPANAMEVEVTGWRWAWEFRYPNGKKTSELTVPIGKPVRLIMTSKDVLHSFFVPQMRVKEDVIKGRYSYLWFTPTRLGDAPVFCAEYCGTLHSKMLSVIHVVSQEEFEDFLVDRSQGEKVELPPAESGAKLFAQKGCVACHSTGANRLVGPGLKGLFAKTEHEMADGTKLAVDENYIRESILNPNAKIVKSFTPIMQSFEGQLTDEELSHLIAYLKTL
jgi:cytochrome c oxidase subunit 2